MEERRGRPVSPEEPAAPERRKPGNRSTKRKGNRPALTCKQGFHLEQPAHTEPQTHSLAPRSACKQSTCLPLGPPGRGPGCWRLPARPRRLRPRGRGSRPPGGCPAPGPGCPARRVGVVAPEVSDPRLRSASGSPGFTLRRRRPQPGRQRDGRGPGFAPGKGCGGDRPRRGARRLAPACETRHTSAGGDGAKPGRGRKGKWPRLPGPRRPAPSLPAASPPRQTPALRAHRPVAYLNSPVHLAKSAAEPPNIPHIDPVTA